MLAVEKERNAMEVSEESKDIAIDMARFATHVAMKLVSLHLGPTLPKVSLN